MTSPAPICSSSFALGVAAGVVLSVVVVAIASCYVEHDLPPEPRSTSSSDGGADESSSSADSGSEG